MGMWTMVTGTAISAMAVMTMGVKATATRMISSCAGSVGCASASVQHEHVRELGHADHGHQEEHVHEGGPIKLDRGHEKHGQGDGKKFDCKKSPRPQEVEDISATIDAL